MDLTRLQTVKALADRIRAEEEKLDVLILNAGAGRLALQKTLTEDGLECNMAVNYFGNFLLATSLLGLSIVVPFLGISLACFISERTIRVPIALLGAREEKQTRSMLCYEFR